MGLQKEREDERGCGNTADAHVKHGRVGGMERNLWQGSPNLETRSESHWRHDEDTHTHTHMHTHMLEFGSNNNSLIGDNYRWDYDCENRKE